MVDREMGIMGKQKPREYLESRQKWLLGEVNKTAFELNGKIVRAMPVGVGGELQRSWTVIPGTPSNPVAIVGTSSSYFLPVEMGRKPGKGISKEGQESVALWATRKLQVSPEKSASFAYLLSRKYKKEGRPAQGLIGLAPPGSQGNQVPQKLEDVVPGSLLAVTFSDLQKKLES